MLTKRRSYDEIKSLCVDQLAADWMENSLTAKTRANVNKKIDSFAEGDHEHTKEILSALWDIVNKDGDITAPSRVSLLVSPFRLFLLPSAARECLLHITSPRSRSRAPLTGPL